MYDNIRHINIYSFIYLSLIVFEQVHEHTISSPYT